MANRRSTVPKVPMADRCRKRYCPTNGDHSAATLPKGTFGPMDERGNRLYWCVRGEEWPPDRSSGFSQEEFDEVTALREIYDGPGFKFSFLVSPATCDCQVIFLLRGFYSALMRGYKHDQPKLTYEYRVKHGYK